jgi:hypothetical protein
MTIVGKRANVNYSTIYGDWDQVLVVFSEAAQSFVSNSVVFL